MTENSFYEFQIPQIEWNSEVGGENSMKSTKLCEIMQHQAKLINMRWYWGELSNLHLPDGTEWKFLETQDTDVTGNRMKSDETKRNSWDSGKLVETHRNSRNSRKLHFRMFSSETCISPWNSSFGLKLLFGCPSTKVKVRTCVSAKIKGKRGTISLFGSQGRLYLIEKALGRLPTQLGPGYYAVQHTSLNVTK